MDAQGALKVAYLPNLRRLALPYTPELGPESTVVSNYYIRVWRTDGAVGVLLESAVSQRFRPLYTGLRAPRHSPKKCSKRSLSFTTTNSGSRAGIANSFWGNSCWRCGAYSQIFPVRACASRAIAWF